MKNKIKFPFLELQAWYSPNTGWITVTDIKDSYFMNCTGFDVMNPATPAFLRKAFGVNNPIDTKFTI